MGLRTATGARALTIDYDDLVAFTRELVRTPSVHRPAAGQTEQAAAGLVADRMRSFGWDPVVEEVAPGRPNVVATVDGGLEGPTLLLEGHTDVVSEGDAAAWTFDPFGGEIVDGRMYGRGSADMKGGLAAAMFAAAAVQRSGPFPGRIVVAALADEEGMMLGAKAFVANGHARGVDAAIVCEPEGGEVCVRQKGAMRVMVTATGRMAHGAMPDHGVSPILALARLTARVEDLEARVQTDAGSYLDLGLPYLTATVIQAGDVEQLNVLPATGRLGIDVRTTPQTDHGHLERSLVSIAGDVSATTGVQLEVCIVEDRPWTETSMDEPVVRALIAAHEEVTGFPPPIGGVPGSTDGTILWRDARIPVVVYGPGGKWIAHQADECVSIAELEQAADVYARAALRFFEKLAGRNTRSIGNHGVRRKREEGQ